MVVVYRSGKVPIEYHSPVISLASFITFILYVAAIVFPYLIAGWTLNFFPPRELIAEKPTIQLKPDIHVMVSGSDTTTNPSVPFVFDFQVGNPYLNSKRIPIINAQMSDQEWVADISAFFPLKDKEEITSAFIQFGFGTKFIKIVDVINTTTTIDLPGFRPAAKVDVFGSVSMIQERDANSGKLPIQYPNIYQRVIDNLRLPPSSNSLLTQANVFFKQREVVWTYGETSMFEINVHIRIPLIEYYKASNGWYSFLSGWSTYIAIAIPLFYIVNFALEALFSSGLITINAIHLGQLNTDKIPKFNR